MGEAGRVPQPSLLFGSHALGTDPHTGTVVGSTWLAEHHQLVLAPWLGHGADRYTTQGWEVHMVEKREKGGNGLWPRINRARGRGLRK